MLREVEIHPHGDFVALPSTSGTAMRTRGTGPA